MATAGDLAGIDSPQVDSVSFAPIITGHPEKQQSHEYLYWEFYERGGKQAVRSGDWKAIRIPMFHGETELYDLSQDIAEAKDVAADHPDVVKKLEAMMDEAHVPHPNWKVRGRAQKK